MIDLLIGAGLGLAGSFLNSWVALKLLRRGRTPKGLGRVVSVYGVFILRYAVDGAVLATAYFWLDKPAGLVAAAVALLVFGVFFTILPGKALTGGRDE